MAHEPDLQASLARHAPKQQEPYLFAGELRPPLPKEEVDRVVAMESLLASSTGRVLGRRSGRPRWEPELKHRLFHHQHKWDRVARAPTLARGWDPCWIPPETSKTPEHRRTSPAGSSLFQVQASTQLPSPASPLAQTPQAQAVGKRPGTRDCHTASARFPGGAWATLDAWTRLKGPMKTHEETTPHLHNLVLSCL